jgi:hypothetical protein
MLFLAPSCFRRSRSEAWPMTSLAGPKQATRSHRDGGCACHTPIGLTKGRFSMLGLRLLL